MERRGLPPATTAAVCGALADVSELGGYFEFGVGPIAPGWRPLTDLVGDRDILEARIADVAARLGTGETRVAASILFQGLAARLWSPPFGAAVAHDLLVRLAPGDVHWLPTPSGPLPLRAARPKGWEAAEPSWIAEPLYRTVVTGLLEPLAATVQSIAKIAPGLLWGNAASALAGTATALARQRPGLSARAVDLARDLLELGHLRGAGEFAEPAPGRHFFVRRSCCLYYRVPGGGTCGDCSLITPAARREQWARAVREKS
ncbi:(2Fe-2S)-binding protein [Nonomuraea sp. NPDC046570]|uniref:(2Fe-2S)-binding protein n=1 Tax=Nonomuraea sp. NPDC046570 TaxID=3155255 RepID=UPI0033D92100